MSDPLSHGKPPKKRWMPKWLKVVLITLAVIFVPIAAFGTVMQIGFDIDTAPMVAIADDLHPAPGWKEDAHNVAGGPFCIGIDVPCDSMWRSYRTEQKITTDDLQKISDAAGLGAKVSGDCGREQPSGNYTGMYTVCSIKGVKEGYDVEVSVAKIAEGYPQRIINFSVSSVKNRS